MPKHSAVDGSGGPAAPGVECVALNILLNNSKFSMCWVEAHWCCLWGSGTASLPHEVSYRVPHTYEICWVER